jgi:hypothetical protein
MPRTVGTKRKAERGKALIGKRYPLNMRTTKEIRDRLEAAARQAGRSLAQEVEYRLDQSFLDEDAWGGAEVQSLLRGLADAARVLQARHGQSIFASFKDYDRARRAWGRLIDLLGPEAHPDLVQSVGTAVEYSLRPIPGPPQNLTPESLAAYKPQFDRWHAEATQSSTVFRKLLDEFMSLRQEGEAVGDSVYQSMRGA